MRLKKIVLGVLAAGLLVAACNSAANVDFKKTSGGIPYKIFPGKGNGPNIKAGNFVKFQITQRIGDSVLHSSYKNGTSEFLKVDTSTVPREFKYEIKYALMEILLNAKEGDSIYITQAIDTFLAKKPELASDTLLKKGGQIISTLRIVKVFQKEADARPDLEAEGARREAEAMRRFLAQPQVQQQMAADDKIIQDYLAKNNIQAKKTEWGTYVQIIQPGSGPSPAPGKFAVVRYKGMDLQGKEFDSNTDPSKPAYPVQIGMGSTVKGFEDGIRQLKKGGSARIFVPSMLGYGPQGNPPAIMANQVLMFDISLEDVTDTPPAMPGQPQPHDPNDGGDHSGHNH
jgi:FKBP-type peptidyl-prolyl cis-trans isomerase